MACYNHDITPVSGVPARIDKIVVRPKAGTAKEFTAYVRARILPKLKSKVIHIDGNPYHTTVLIRIIQPELASILVDNVKEGDYLVLEGDLAPRYNADIWPNIRTLMWIDEFCHDESNGESDPRAGKIYASSKEEFDLIGNIRKAPFCVSCGTEKKPVPNQPEYKFCPPCETGQ